MDKLRLEIVYFFHPLDYFDLSCFSIGKARPIECLDHARLPPCRGESRGRRVKFRFTEYPLQDQPRHPCIRGVSASVSGSLQIAVRRYERVLTNGSNQSCEAAGLKKKGEKKVLLFVGFCLIIFVRVPNFGTGTTTDWLID